VNVLWISNSDFVLQDFEPAYRQAYRSGEFQRRAVIAGLDDKSFEANLLKVKYEEPRKDRKDRRRRGLMLMAVIDQSSLITSNIHGEYVTPSS